jgi:hypothetical protein
MTSLPHDLASRILDGSPDAVLVCDRMGTVGKSLSSSQSSLKDADRAVQCVVAFIRDVTERYDREQQLRARLSALEGRIGCRPSER